MASTYSDRLRIELIGTGEQSGTWGVTTNTNLGTLLEESVAGVAQISLPDADYTLTTANGATDEARQAVLLFTGTLSAARNVICPTKEKVYVVKNSTTGGYSVTLKTSAGSGITVANGNTAFVFCDGTNVVTALTTISASSPTFTGTISLDGATVVNDSGAAVDFRVEGDTDANLLFVKGSNDRVGVGTSSPATKFDLSGAMSSNITAVSVLDIDCSKGNYFTKTINANSTFTFSNAPSSRAYAFTLELTHTSGTVTWPTSVKWPSDTAPSLTAGKTHLFMFVTDDAGTRWRGAALVDYTN